MTSAAAGNIYFFNLFSQLFLDYEGNSEWIYEGYEKIPLKLQKLWELVWANYYHPTATFRYYKELYGYLNEVMGQKEIFQAQLVISFTDYLITIAYGAGVTELEFN